MAWHVIGTRIEFTMSRHGLTISGEGTNYVTNMADPAPADHDISALGMWAIHRASQAADVASAVSENTKTKQRLLTPEKVRALQKPLNVITWSGDLDPPFVAFYTFLPDQSFEDVWKVAALAAQTNRYRNWLRYEFEGFSAGAREPARLSAEDLVHPELRPPSYAEWTEGAPCISIGEFSFQLLERDGHPPPPAASTKLH